MQRVKDTSRGVPALEELPVEGGISLLKALGQDNECPDSLEEFRNPVQLTQEREVEGKGIDWEIYMDMHFIREGFLRELDLDRGLKQNVRFKCSMVIVQ